MFSSGRHWGRRTGAGKRRLHRRHKSKFYNGIGGHDRRRKRHLHGAPRSARPADPRSIRPTQIRNLVRLGVNLDMAIKHAISRKSYWRLSRTPAMRYAMPNKWLEQLGLLSLKQLWCDIAPLRGTA